MSDNILASYIAIYEENLDKRIVEAIDGKRKIWA